MTVAFLDIEAMFFFLQLRWGAIHSTKISGNFGLKLNGSVRSNRKSFEKIGPPFEVDHFSRLDRSNRNGPFHLTIPTHSQSQSRRNLVQSTELDIVNGSFCNLCALPVGLALHIFATQCWAPRRAKQLITVAILLYRFLSCWCLETFSRSITLAVYCLSSIPVPRCSVFSRNI